MAQEPAGASKWLELSVRASAEAVDAIVEVFRSRGIGGVAIEPSIEPGADDGVVLDGRCVVKAYVPLDGGTAQRVLELDQALWHLRAFDLSPLSELNSRVIAEEDWANAWKEHFHPLRLGKRIVVKPSWREVEASPEDLVIELDPGMAFGTGLHPTTRMVLEEMEAVIRPGQSVLDVGTGSGILAIAAAKLGASEVLAVDVDAVAVRVAAENVALNGTGEVVTVGAGSMDGIAGSYDVILANIIASVISELAPAFAGRMKPDGTLLASGIIADRLPMVEDAFDAAGLRVDGKRQSGCWICLIARRA